MVEVVVEVRLSSSARAPTSVQSKKKIERDSYEKCVGEKRLQLDIDKARS